MATSFGHAASAAEPNKDGKVIVHVSHPMAPNHLRIMPNCNDIVRLYRPRDAILDGSWSGPTPVPAK